jgi:cell shape-determining protein MreC
VPLAIAQESLRLAAQNCRLEQNLWFVEITKRIDHENAEIKGLSVDQLKEQLTADRSSARNLRFAHAISLSRTRCASASREILLTDDRASHS